MAPPAPQSRPGAARPPSSSRRVSTRSSASSVASSLSCSYSSATGSSPPSASLASSPSSPSTERNINSIIFRQPSIRGLEEERKSFARGLSILEPRPIVYWSSLEERMGSMSSL